MAISLRIGKGTKARHVPVASQDEFKRTWKPGCAALGLSQVGLMMDAGLSIAPGEANELLVELYQLRGWMVAKGATSAVTRVDEVIAALRAQGRDELYFG